MLTITSEPVINHSYTPSWIKSERYLYCDNFPQDLTENSRATILGYVRKLLQK